MNCTRCEGTGFLNLEQLNGQFDQSQDLHGDVLNWIVETKSEADAIGGCSCHMGHPPCSWCLLQHDVQVCDCCGNGEGWHGTPGEHNNFRGDSAAEPFPRCY